MTVIDPAPPIPGMGAVLDLVDCLCEELDPVCWCGLWHGQQVSWDYCGGECQSDVCGMAWVRLVSVFPYQSFPNPFIDLRCAQPLAAEIEVGCLRCMPTMQADGSLPSAQAIGESSLQSIADTFAMYRSIQCCSTDFAVGIYQPLGPLGGCVGGTWTTFVELMAGG